MRCLFTSRASRTRATTTRWWATGQIDRRVQRPCIPSSSYGHPMTGPGEAWKFITGREARTLMGELGWKSLGVLELTALPSIDEEHWVPWSRAGPGTRPTRSSWPRRPGRHRAAGGTRLRTPWAHRGTSPVEGEHPECPTAFGSILGGFSSSALATPLRDDRWHGGCGERPRCATRATARGNRRPSLPVERPASVVSLTPGEVVEVRLNCGFVEETTGDRVGVRRSRAA